MKRSKYILYIWAIGGILAFTGCNDFLDRSPQGQFTEDDNPGALAEGKIFNIYTMMRNFNITAGTPAFAIHCFRSEDSEKGSISSDGSEQAAMYDDFQYNASNGLIKAYWSQNYAIIYQCNEVVDAIETGHLTEENDLYNKGEALFFRAYCYFNLVRAFGEVPLVTFKVNEASEANVPKTTVDKIYEQIDKDLKDAEDVMGKEIYNLDTPYDKIFTDEGENSGGSVFELQCLSTAALPQSDKIGSQFCEVQGIRGSGKWDLGWGWHMATELMAEAFEPGDPRKDATLLYFRKSDSDPVTPENTNTPYGESPVSQAEGAYFNKKAYTNPALRQEFTNKGFWVNIRLIRYSDVVLMAAESANELGNTSEAQKDLEMVRARARGGNPDILPEITSLDQSVLREAIRHERRVELGLEFDRFYDLVRWGIAEQVLHAAGKLNYQPKNALLPIPQDEIDKSKGVLKQNPDYL